MVKTRRRKTVKNRTMKKQIKNRQLRKRRTKKRGGAYFVGKIPSMNKIQSKFQSLEKNAANDMYKKIDEIYKLILNQQTNIKITEKTNAYTNNSKYKEVTQGIKKIHDKKIEGFKENLKNIKDIERSYQEDIQRLKETNKESEFIDKFIKHFLKNIINNNKEDEKNKRIYYIFIFLIIVYYNEKMMEMNDVDIGNLKNSMNKDETIFLKQIIESLENMFQHTQGLFNLINLADVFKNISIDDFKEILIENMYKTIYELKSPGGRRYKPDYIYKLIKGEAENLNNEFKIYRFQNMKNIDHYDITKKYDKAYGVDIIEFNKQYQIQVHKKFVDKLFGTLNITSDESGNSETN